mmetsp:Transcript_2061/g.3829  ORF Transcript_2061/g.3829 Transcript_2061/m.3829 type:complete len:271 (-) Transcript_2061:825-1637(-)
MSGSSAKSAALVRLKLTVKSWSATSFSPRPSLTGARRRAPLGRPLMRSGAGTYTWTTCFSVVNKLNCAASGTPHCSRWAFTGGMERLITDSLRCTVSVDSNPLASPTVKICSSDAPPVMLRAEAPTNVFVCSYLFKPGTARYLDTILHTTTHGVCVALERTTGKPAAKWLQPWVDCGRAMCLLEAESLVFRQFDTHSSGKEIWHQQSGLWELYFIKPLNPLDLSQCISLSSLTIGLQNITQSIRKRGHCAQCFLPIASSPHTRRHASCQL